MNDGHYLTALPEGNCIFNKVRTGCGGTTLALESPIPYVIAEPLVSIIEDKYRQCCEKGIRVIRVHEGITDEMILEALRQGVNKLLTTYDSLKRVVYLFNSYYGTNGWKKYRLLVDDFHILFLQYQFRRKAARAVLDHFKYFSSYLFMSATPISSGPNLVELEGLPVITERWKDNDPFRVRLVECKDSLAGAEFLIRLYTEGVLDGNLFIFVNSVRLIDDLARRADLDDTNARAIYSKNNEYATLLKRSDINSPIKKITFITSAAFEGCDFIDADARIAIVSKKEKESTLLDVATTIIQIRGRVRNARRDEPIIHLFEKGAENLSGKEYDDHTRKIFETEEKFTQFVNSLSDEERAYLNLENQRYHLRTDSWSSEYFPDENIRRSDIYSRQIMDHYSSSKKLKSAYRKNSIRIDNSGDRVLTQALDIMARIEKLDIKTLLDEYNALKSSKKKARTIKDFLLNVICKKSPEFKKLAETDGTDFAVRSVPCLSSLKSVIRNKTNREQDHAVALKLDYKKDSFHPKSDIRADLRKIFSELQITARPAAKLITRFYDAHPQARTINGKKVDGYLIQGKKRWGGRKKKEKKND